MLLYRICFIDSLLEAERTIFTGIWDIKKEILFTLESVTQVYRVYFYIITFKAKHRCIIPCRSLADLGERFAKYIPKTRIALWRGNILLQKIMYFVKLWPISSGHLKEPDLKYICTCIGHQTNRRTNLIQTHEPSMSSLLPPFIIEIHVHKCLSYVTWKSRFAIWLSCIIICNKI